MGVEVECGERSIWIKTKQEILDAKQGKMQSVCSILLTLTDKNTIQETDTDN